MTDPKSYYRTGIECWRKELAAWRNWRNLVTVLRVVFFLGLIFGIVGIAIFENRTLWFGISGGMVVVFIILGILDMRVSRRIFRAEESVRCCRVEEAYLEGKLEGLDTGVEFYQTPQIGGHAYVHDLDILGEDSLFQRINRTETYGGKQLLVSWLLHPCKEAGEIRARQRAVVELGGKPDWRLQFRVAGMLRKTGKTDLAGMEEWLNEKPIFSSKIWGLLLLFMNLAMFGAIVTAIINLVGWNLPLILFFVQLGVVGIYLKRINQLHQRVERFVKVLGGYSDMIGLVDREPFESDRMVALKGQLVGGKGNAKYGFKRLVRILNDLDQRGNLLVAVLLNGLYLRDIYVVRSLERWRERYSVYVPVWRKTIEQVDALVSMGYYRFNHPDYVLPQIVEDVLLEGQGMGHPMLGGDLREMVRNDFGVGKLHELYIVTGANMAGKSTFLRTVGVNLVLALSGNVVCAGRFRCSVMGIFTSMRTTDNLSKGTSYFHAELLRLQQLISMATGEEKLFIILDEMLKGTNSTDKLNGSLRFLEKLLQYPVAGLVATHDLGLGELAERFGENFRNVCFEIGHTADDIVYDYKLKPGVSRNMNASILLEKMGLI